MKAKSKEGKRIAGMNKYPHHLGSGGYEGKSAEWKTALEQNRDFDSPVVQIQNPRGQCWFMGRSELTADGKIVLPQKLQPVAQRMVRVLCYNFVSFKRNYNSECTSIGLLL